MIHERKRNQQQLCLVNTVTKFCIEKKRANVNRCKKKWADTVQTEKKYICAIQTGHKFEEKKTAFISYGRIDFIIPQQQATFFCSF